MSCEECDKAKNDPMQLYICREHPLQSKVSVYINELKNSLQSLLSWTYSGACSDCDMFRVAPSCIDFLHHKECAHLEDINKALVLLGKEPERFHSYEDPKAEMRRLHEERVIACRKEKDDGQ